MTKHKQLPQLGASVKNYKQVTFWNQATKTACDRVRADNIANIVHLTSDQIVPTYSSIVEGIYENIKRFS